MSRYLFANSNFVIGAGLLVAALVMLIIIPFLAVQDARYDSDGATIRGEVVRKLAQNSSSTNRETRPRLIVVYEFTPPSTGIKQQGRTTVSQSTFNSLEVNGPVSVDYLVNDPATNRLSGESGGGGMMVIAPILLLVFGAVGSYMAGAGWRAARGLVHLRDNGQPHSAVVTDIARSNLRTNNKRNFYAVYEYTGPDKEKLTGKSVPRPLEDFDGLRAGDNIDIVVGTKDPSKSAWSEGI